MLNNIKRCLSLLLKEIKSISLSSRVDLQKHKTTATTKNLSINKIIFKGRKIFTQHPNLNQRVKVKIILSHFNLKRK